MVRVPIHARATSRVGASFTERTASAFRMTPAVLAEDELDLREDYRLAMERRLRHTVGSRWFAPVGLLLFSQWEIWVGGQTHQVGPLGVTAVTVAVAAVLLLWRRAAPLVVQLGSVAVTLWPWLVWGAPQNGALFLVGVASTYSVGRWGRRPSALLGIPVVVGWTLCQLALDPLQSSLSANWGWALWGVGAWLAGAWVRQRVELEIRQATERETSARVQLAEQRLDIARDLHDVLANSLGVIVVHAEAAEALLAKEPQRAAEAIRRVQSTGREALREVRGVLGSLRENPDREEPSLTESRPPEPQDAGPTRPDLDDVDALLRRMQQAGLPVVCRREGDDPVPVAVSRAAYRLVQEALSNVIRHAGLVPTLACIRVDTETVMVEVTNAASPEQERYQLTDLVFGHGLRGMEERLQALGGTLDASVPSEGGFRVRAVVPLTPRPAPGASLPASVTVTRRAG